MTSPDGENRRNTSSSNKLSFDSSNRSDGVIAQSQYSTQDQEADDFTSSWQQFQAAAANDGNNIVSNNNSNRQQASPSLAMTMLGQRSLQQSIEQQKEIVLQSRKEYANCMLYQFKFTVVGATLGAMSVRDPRFLPMLLGAVGGTVLDNIWVCDACPIVSERAREAASSPNKKSIVRCSRPPK